MILLDATTESLEITTTAAVSIDYHIAYADHTSTTFTPGSTEGNIASATTTAVLTAPAASTQRQVKLISVRNRHASSSQTVTVIKDVSATEYHLTPAVTLLAGEHLLYVDGVGWTHYTADGLVKLSTSVTVATDAIWDAKGDLAAGTAANTAAALTVGANDTILMADSGQATGLKWVASQTPSTQAYSDAAAEGTADTYARGDHKHGMPADSAGGMPPIILRPYGNEPPSASYATIDLRNGHPVLDFDADADEEAIWTAVLPASYAGGGLTVNTWWGFTSAVAGSARIEVMIERMDVSSLDIDADSFAASQSGAAAAPGTSGQFVKVAIAFTSGAQMDSLAAGEQFRVKVRRDANGTTGTDDATGDAEFLIGQVVET